MTPRKSGDKEILAYPALEFSIHSAAGKVCEDPRSVPGVPRQLPSQRVRSEAPQHHVDAGLTPGWTAWRASGSAYVTSGPPALHVEPGRTQHGLNSRNTHNL